MIEYVNVKDSKELHKKLEEEGCKTIEDKIIFIWFGRVVEQYEAMCERGYQTMDGARAKLELYKNIHLFKTIAVVIDEKKVNYSLYKKMMNFFDHSQEFMDDIGLVIKEQQNKGQA